ncbi:hypothetical protein [Agrobacterium burrii]
MRILGIFLIIIGIPLSLMIPFAGPVLVITGLFMIVAGFGSSNAKKTAKALAKQMQAMQPQAAPVPATNADTDRWAALARYDDEIRAAVEQVRPYGSNALDRLRTTYLALNDKAKLPTIIADIQQEFGPTRS